MKRKLLLTLTLAIGLVGCTRPDDISPVAANTTGRFVVESVGLAHVSGTTPDLAIYVVKDKQGSNDFVVFSGGSASVTAMPISRPSVKLEDTK